MRCREKPGVPTESSGKTTDEDGSDRKGDCSYREFAAGGRLVAHLEKCAIVCHCAPRQCAAGGSANPENSQLTTETRCTRRKQNGANIVTECFASLVFSVLSVSPW